MIQTPQSPAFYSNSPMYERPPARLEHRTTARTNVRTPGDLVRSWEAFDRLFEDAFAPSHQATEPDRSETQSQFTEDNQTQSAFDTPKPQGGATRQLYDETPQSEFTQLYDDGATEMTADTETPLPGRYPRSYPLPDDTPQSIRAPFPDNGGGADEIASSADEDFQRLWEEAERNRRKRMTRTVTRRRILQHGVMSPSGTVSTIQPEPEQKLRRKKSRFRLYRNGNPDYVTATFDVPDVRKEDVHVAFQNSQLTITWESIITTERRSDDRTIIREKKERKYARTLPLPPNTEFSDIKAYLENGVLTVMYPKFPGTNSRAPRSITR